MSTGIGCTVWIDGVRVADGSPTDAPDAVYALSGLQITFGRSTTVDQPQASSLQFSMMDEPGGQRFVDLLRTGRAVDVRAVGTIYVDPDTSTITDPGFDDTPLTQAPANVYSSTAVATVRLLDGDPALRAAPRNSSVAQSVTIAPAPFSSELGAWDEIPRLSPGQIWTVSVDVSALPGARITLQPVGYPDPDGAGLVILGDPAQATGTGAMQTVTAQVNTQTISDVWVGVRVMVYPVGPTWQATDGTWQDNTGTWLERGVFWLDNIDVLAPSGGVTRDVLVYSGRITDIAASWDDGPGGARVDITAADFTADLDNIKIGDEPWSAEPMEDRFQRILDLSGLQIEAIIDSSIATPIVSYQDVDAQAVTGLLQDLAQSVDGVMWSATHLTTGPYIHVEDPAQRPALYVLALDEETGLVIIVPAADLPEGVELSACDVLRDPVSWIQNVSDVSTRAAITWAEQGVDDDGNPTTTDRTITVIDAQLEQEHGQRSISVSTMLTTEADAGAVADRILARSSLTGWRISGVTIDDGELEIDGNDATNLLLQLLDGTARNGLGITLTDLPVWSPIGNRVPGYLEGGQYVFEDGAWVLQLTISRAATQGTSVAWIAVPIEWTWIMFDLQISWSDLFGVAEPEEVAA